MQRTRNRGPPRRHLGNDLEGLGERPKAALPIWSGELDPYRFGTGACASRAIGSTPTTDFHCSARNPLKASTLFVRETATYL